MLWYTSIDFYKSIKDFNYSRGILTVVFFQLISIVHFSTFFVFSGPNIIFEFSFLLDRIEVERSKVLGSYEQYHIKSVSELISSLFRGEK